jgi:PPK2 family polyphosphate:nucleotide phosphotransferase
MKNKQVIERARKFCKPYRVTNGKKFRLKDVDPGDTQDLKSEDKARAREALQNGIEALAELQDMLYAQDRWSVLLVFQAMDAAGKDGTIKHVMSGVNPQGCQVSSFKAPTSDDLDHDYLWRCMKCLPERGRIGIFNRSYYEETLVVRVHPEFLAGQKLPEECVTKKIWDERFQDIRAFERYLHRNGTIVRKFFLHVSKKEQQKRFLARLDLPEKNWKFSAADARERGFWDDYMKAYEETIRETATSDSPWYVVPADNKWFTRVVVAGAVIDALASLKLHYPKVSDAKRAELVEARKLLVGRNEPRRQAVRAGWPIAARRWLRGYEHVWFRADKAGCDARGVACRQRRRRCRRGLPSEAGFAACLLGSGFFAVRGRRRSRSPQRSRCSSARRSVGWRAVTRRVTRRSPPARRYSWR